MDPVVETRSGKVRGVPLQGAIAFRGIPYARAPIGALRFREPAAPEPWTGVKSCEAFGPPAVQPPGMGVMPALRADQSEDCLSLNVWTPGLDRSARRPVMVWVHGGGFVNGSGAEALYDGLPLCRRGDVVVVTINYRLGALGFLDLRSVLPDAQSNLGLRDQLAALRWVREHIDGFGGDPDNVTLFGESAGAMSIACLLASPQLEGLVHRAVTQSGAAHHLATEQDSAEVSAAFLKALDVTTGDATRLRQLPAQTLVKAHKGCMRVAINPHAERGRLPLYAFPFLPTYGDDVLPEEPLSAMAKGAGRDVALLTGTNFDEWTMFVYLTAGGKKDMDEARLRASVERRVPGRAEHLIEGYRRTLQAQGRDTRPVDLFIAIEGDRFFGIPSVRMAEAREQAGAESYQYLFTWNSPMLGGALKSAHAIEIPFVFGSLGDRYARSLVGFSDAAQALSDCMMDAWLGFARAGAPTAPGLPKWPSYRESDRQTMVLGAEPAMLRADPCGDQRVLWDGVC